MRSSEVVVRRNNLPSPGKRHLAALDALFIEVLMLCREAGMVKMGRVALDGTKVRANASRHKAMSYERMCQSEARLAAEVAEMMHQAERVDAEEDAVHGADNRGGDLQGEMARRESRLAKIRKAKADLEQHAKDRAAQKARAKASKNGQGDEVAEESAGRAAEAATPDANPGGGNACGGDLDSAPPCGVASITAVTHPSSD